MKNPENIIHEYRESDPEEQLHLFLDNPALRNAFIEADIGACATSYDTSRTRQTSGVEVPPEKREPSTDAR